MAFILNAEPSQAQSYYSSAPVSLKRTYKQQTDSGTVIIFCERLGGKNYFITEEFIPLSGQAVTAIAERQPVSARHKARLITIHGNVSYEFFYRSRIDTPFNLRDYQQHTERVSLNILIKEKYPLRLNITGRQSNSPYFRDFADINFGFDRFAFTKKLREQLLEQLKKQIPAVSFPDLRKAQEEYRKALAKAEKTRNWLEDPATLQRIVEEREQQYYQRLRMAADSATEKSGADQLMDSIGRVKQQYLSLSNQPAAIQKKLTDTLAGAERGIEEKKEKMIAQGYAAKDSVAGSYAAFYEQQKKELKELNKIADRYKSKADSLEALAQKDIAAIRQKVNSATSEKELRKIAEKSGITLERKEKLEKILGAVKTISIGRSVLNYTELTAQNITVTGVNIEYNPSYYAAFAAGKIDYRFRDFFNRGQKNRNQYIVLGRLGWGDKDSKGVIFTWFTGRKSDNYYSSNDSVNSAVNIIGYSAEAFIRKDENTFVSAEYAKSTKPVSGNLVQSKQTAALLHFRDQTNTGINFKGQTVIPETHTRLSGFFRKTGEQFQSFSLFTYNTNQLAWQARVDQSFSKDRITVTGMLRRNDFTNPFTDKTYKTSTVFKSMQLHVRFRKFPTVSVGYFPGTQLYIVDNEKIRESAYYILNGTAGYSYAVKGLLMNSTVVYNKYTQEATDSGFMAYQGISYYLSHAVRIRNWQFQVGYAYTRQSPLEYSTIESMADIRLKDWLSAGAGIKYNNVAGGAEYWGKSMQLKADFKKWGGVQLQYEKMFFPTLQKTLAPVEIGRVGYYRMF